jgi:hypothetical protein
MDIRLFSVVYPLSLIKYTLPDGPGNVYMENIFQDIYNKTPLLLSSIHFQMVQEMYIYMDIMIFYMWYIH